MEPSTRDTHCDIPEQPAINEDIAAAKHIDPVEPEPVDPIEVDPCPIFDEYYCSYTDCEWNDVPEG